MRRDPAFAWREYANYFRPHRATLLWVALAGVAQSFSYVPFAAILRHTFDVVLPARDAAGLWLAAAGLLALQLTALGLNYAMRMATLRVNETVLRNIRCKGVAHLYNLPRSFFTAADLDRLHVTLVHETIYLSSMNNAVLAGFFPATLGALVLFAIMLWTQPLYALIIGVAVPFLFVFDRLLERDLWLRSDILRAAFKHYSAGVRFVLASIDLTRSQTAEQFELGRQDANVQALERVSLELSRYDSIQQLAGTSLLLIVTIGVLVAGGYAVARGSVTRGEMMAFYVIAALFATQARAMVSAIPDIRLGARAYGELHELLTDPGREPYRGTHEIDRIDEIRLEQVAFEYVAGRPVLNDVTLAIRPGTRFALIGANGSGKSSMVHLISGHYRPRHGRVLANGRAYDELSMHSVRARIALVPQNPLLFAGSVLENVAYGRSEPEREENVRQALDWAGAAEFVEALPEGLNTAIGELGVRLSGGQRQRLVIARALLRRPDLLILDEPTNHLDEDAVEHLMDTLDVLPFRPAILVISHELRVLRHVDHSFKLENGRLTELDRPEKWSGLRPQIRS